jgi:hypothetical protein
MALGLNPANLRYSVAGPTFASNGVYAQSVFDQGYNQVHEAITSIGAYNAYFGPNNLGVGDLCHNFGPLGTPCVPNSDTFALDQAYPGFSNALIDGVRQNDWPQGGPLFLWNYGRHELLDWAGGAVDNFENQMYGAANKLTGGLLDLGMDNARPFGTPGQQFDWSERSDAMDNITAQSHFGQYQIWHSMSPDSTLTNTNVRDLIIGQLSDWYSSALCSQAQSPDGIGLMGRISHTIEDSFSGGHVLRGDDGTIQAFYNYNSPGQSQFHSAYDGFDNQDQIDQAIAAVTGAFMLYKQGAPLEAFQAYLTKYVYPIAPGYENSLTNTALFRRRGT